VDGTRLALEASPSVREFRVLELEVYFVGFLAVGWLVGCFEGLLRLVFAFAVEIRRGLCGGGHPWLEGWNSKDGFKRA
jgi:hypothetical protein